MMDPLRDDPRFGDLMNKLTSIALKVQALQN